MSEDKIFIVQVPVEATLTYAVTAKDADQAKRYVRRIIGGPSRCRAQGVRDIMFANRAWDAVSDPIPSSWKPKTALEHYDKWMASSNSTFHISCLYSNIQRLWGIVKHLAEVEKVNT